jgi:membrane fusion protein (multidrug efflux system)
MRRPKLLFYAAALGLLPVLGCAPPPASGPAKPAPPVLEVKMGSVKRGNATRSITVPATVVAFQQAVLYAKVSGYAKTVNVDKGDTVKANDLLAEVEVPELLADRARYKAELEVASLDQRRIVEALKKAPDLVVAQEVDAARGKQDIAKANLERTETLLGFCRITAPFAGVITSRRIDPGAFIAAATSSSASAGMFTVMDFNKVRVQAAIPESEVPLIKVGLAAFITIEELRRPAFNGQVTRFSHALDETTRTMLTEIELPNPSGELRPGMYAKVRLVVETKPDALIIPAEALLTEKNRVSVFTVVENKAKRLTVRAGFADAGQVEILEGVPADAPVILLGKQTPADGQTVTIAKTQ